MTISEAMFRASPRFDLRRLDELTPEQRRPFDELTRDADFYGLLVPRTRAATIKSVGGEMAGLFRALATPSRLDGAPLDREELIDLVLDGVLEIEHDGAFLSGADALPLLCDDAATLADGLALEALLYATDLEETDVDTMTRALYLYNRIPMTQFWKERFADREAVLAHIGAAGETLSSWNLLTPEQAAGWLTFQARNRGAYQRGASVYKLYVSPRPENIRDAFAAVVRTLAGRDIDFKVGQDASGLLRPDKMVAYFSRREELDAFAATLRARLTGCPAHGVPFTAHFAGGDGLLSWGVDPPDSERALSWQGRESWRLWVASKLGTAIAFAKSESSRAVEPWRFAVERVRRLGVDVQSWTPAESLWRAA